MRAVCYTLLRAASLQFLVIHSIAITPYVRRMSDFEFTDVSGQTLTKEPGSLNGWDPS